MATHSSILAWRIPWTKEPGYSPRGHKESDTIEATEQQFQKYFALLFPHNEVSSGGEECHSHEEVWGRVEEQF